MSLSISDKTNTTTFSDKSKNRLLGCLSFTENRLVLVYLKIHNISKRFFGKMAKISNKLFDIFRNLKSDAIPRSPRPENETINEENVQQNDDIGDATNTEIPEQIFVEPDELKKEKKKSKFKNTFFKATKNKNSFFNDEAETDDRRNSSSSNVNTQAAGNVINIVNSPDFHWGNNFTYYFGPKVNNDTHKNDSNDEDDEQKITKCHLITLLMEAQIKPEHEYINYISQNLGKNWKRFFRSLGYMKGRIDTVEIEQAKYGISEARYKLLLDWTRNNDGTLGQLATKLWDEGERQIVKELAIMHKKNTK